MDIGIIGSGDVGRTLGAGLASLGHTVQIGTRDQGGEKIKDWLDANKPRSRVGTFSEAAEFGELAVLATLWSGTENAIRLATPANLAGKIVIDVTNPLVFKEGAPPALALGHTDSGGEQVQRWLPDSKVVKAFNTVGHASMVNPKFENGPPDMFICGNDEDAKKTVGGICKAFGWGVVDIGDITGARLLEPMCILWVKYGANANSWTHAFKLLRK
jgi:8-hydroxy-5-deazaflavin:NADPH oxidoreductase